MRGGEGRGGERKGGEVNSSVLQVLLDVAVLFPRVRGREKGPEGVGDFGTHLSF